MKIGIIGGSFDPFHLGHKRIINETISKLNLDKMLIMPTKHNPWKDDCVANDKQRIAMIHLTMEGNKQYEISRIELDNPTNEKNYTIDTIKTLKQLYPSDELYFIMGMDQASQFDKWKCAQEISQEVQLVAFGRVGYQINENINTYHFKFIETKETDESSTALKKGKRNVRNVYKTK